MTKPTFIKFTSALAFLFLLAFSADAQRIRRLLLFADDSTNVKLKTQRQWLEAERQGVEDRDIWIAVFDDPKVLRRMYEHYDVGRAPFYVVLVGKDGEVKLRSEELVPARDLFELIDSPPQKQAGAGDRTGGN